MHQAIELPLTLHLLFASQAEAVQPFVAADIAEHGFHYRHPVTVDFFAFLAIHSVLHPVGIRRASPQLQGVRDLSSFAFVVIRRTGVLHALMLLRAWPALQ